MATSTTINGFPKPELSDVPNIETAVGNLANAVDSRVVPVFSTTGARDTAIASPSFGMMAAVSGTGELYMYNGSLWVSARPRTIYKASNETVTSSTVLQNDNDFAISLEANALYKGKLTLAYGAGGGDFRSLWTFPSGATGLRWKASLMETGQTVNQAWHDQSKVSLFSAASPANDVEGLGGTTPAFWIEDFTIDTAGTSGTLQFTWCQASSSATATTVYAGSVLEIWKVG